MMVIPIVSLINLANFTVLLFLAVKLYRSYRATGDGSIKYFFLCFLSLAIGFFLTGGPGTFNTNPYTMTAASIVANACYTLGAMFFTIIPLRLLGFSRLRTVYVVCTVSFVILVAGVRAAAFEPMAATQEGNFVFYSVVGNPSVELARTLSGIVIAFSTLLAGLTFLVYGFRHRKDRYVKIRSLLLGSGALLLGAAGFINYIVGAASTMITLVASASLAIIGLFVLIFAVFYKQREHRLDSRAEA